MVLNGWGCDATILSSKFWNTPLVHETPVEPEAVFVHIGLQMLSVMVYAS